MPMFAFSRSLSHSRHRCKQRASVGRARGLRWERVAQVAQSPSRAEGISSACGAQPTTHSICQGGEWGKKREERGFSNYHMGLQVSCLAPYAAVSMSVYLHACLYACLFASWTKCCLSVVKLWVPRWRAHDSTEVSSTLDLKRSCVYKHTQTYICALAQMPTSTVPACVIIIFINYVNSYVNTRVTRTHTHPHSHRFSKIHAF